MLACSDTLATTVAILVRRARNATAPWGDGPAEARGGRWRTTSLTPPPPPSRLLVNELHADTQTPSCIPSPWPAAACRSTSLRPARPRHPAVPASLCPPCARLRPSRGRLRESCSRACLSPQGSGRWRGWLACVAQAALRLLPTCPQTALCGSAAVKSQTIMQRFTPPPRCSLPSVPAALLRSQAVRMPQESGYAQQHAAAQGDTPIAGAPARDSTAQGRGSRASLPPPQRSTPSSFCR